MFVLLCLSENKNEGNSVGQSKLPNEHILEKLEFGSGLPICGETVTVSNTADFKLGLTSPCWQATLTCHVHNVHDGLCYEPVMTRLCKMPNRYDYRESQSKLWILSTLWTIYGSTLFVLCFFLKNTS